MPLIHHGRLLGSGTLDELRALTGRDYLDEIFRALVAGAEETG